MSCQSESLRHGQSYYKYIHEESGRTVDPIYDKSQKFLALLMGVSQTTAPSRWRRGHFDDT